MPRENIIGKPVVIYWSYDAPTEQLLESGIGIDHLADLAQHFFTKTRWITNVPIGARLSTINIVVSSRFPSGRLASSCQCIPDSFLPI